MKITVTQEHINKGTPNSCAYCPIALAISEKRGVAFVDIGSATFSDKLHVMVSWKNGTTKFYKFPSAARIFIIQFDRYGHRYGHRYGAKKVEPFTFEAKMIQKSGWM